MTRVRVGIRVRPLNVQERNSGAREVTKIFSNPEPDSLQLFLPSKSHPVEKPPESDLTDTIGSRRFSFDFCLSPSTVHQASQLAVYETVGQPTLAAMLGGYNSCIFAYGQSGTGKSYTVTGTRSDVGLLSRICQVRSKIYIYSETGRTIFFPSQGLFEEIQEVKDKRKFFVEVSFLELYEERIHDLLQSSRTLRLREHPQLGPFAEGLLRRRVCSVEEVNVLLKQARENRLKTTSQDQDRKSHQVFSLRCHQELSEQERSLISELHLVDLAGSERLQERSESKQQVSNVNKSLVTLGIVISALGESGKHRPPWSESGDHLSCRSSPYVPFRSSALTWLLKETLGGNCVTCVIATISPSSCCYKDTLSTLRYAERARSIRNRPVVNERPAQCLRRIRKDVETSKRTLTEAMYLTENPHINVSAGEDDLKPVQDSGIYPSATVASCSSFRSNFRTDKKPICRFRSETALHQLTCFFVVRCALTFNTCLASALIQPGASVDKSTDNIEPTNSDNYSECLPREFMDSEPKISQQRRTKSAMKAGSKTMPKICLLKERLTKTRSFEAGFPRLPLSKECSRSCPTLITTFNGGCDGMLSLDRSVEGAVDNITCTYNSGTRERLSSCYSTDSVEDSARPLNSCEETGNLKPYPQNLPFRLGQNSSSPEPSMFSGSKEPLKSNIWPRNQVPNIQKFSPTSSLDSITYVFLDSEPGSSRIPQTAFNSTQDWVSQSVLKTTHRPSSLSTLDSLEIDNAETRSRKSPRTLSVDSVLLEECLRSIREENSDQLIVEPTLPCESSGISSKSDSSSISIQSGSSSTTRRRDSFGMQSTFTVPSAQTRLQTDLIQLITEVVHLLAAQQRIKKPCRCRRKPRIPRAMPVSKECDQMRKRNDGSEKSRKARELLEQEIRTLREDRVHVKQLLEGESYWDKQWCFPEARPKVSLPLSTSSSRDSKDDQEDVTLAMKEINVAEADKLSRTVNSWEVIDELCRFPRQLQDSGVDCCSDPVSPNQTSASNEDECHPDTTCRPSRLTSQFTQATAATCGQSGALSRDWSSRSEREKDRLLTWMEKELDLLERTLAPLDYRPLPEKFLKPSSLNIPIPKEILQNTELY